MFPHPQLICLAAFEIWVPTLRSFLSIGTNKNRCALAFLFQGGCMSYVFWQSLSNSTSSCKLEKQQSGPMIQSLLRHTWHRFSPGCMILKDNERVERRFGGMGSDGRVQIFWRFVCFWAGFQWTCSFLWVKKILVWWFLCDMNSHGSQGSKRSFLRLAETGVLGLMTTWCKS